MRAGFAVTFTGVPGSAGAQAPSTEMTGVSSSGFPLLFKGMF